MKNSFDSRLDELDGFPRADPRGYDQHASGEPAVSGGMQEIENTLGAQVKIQQDDGWLKTGCKQTERFGGGAAAPDNGHVGFLPELLRESVAEHGVVIDEKETDRFGGRVKHGVCGSEPGAPRRERSSRGRPVDSAIRRRSCEPERGK